MYEGVIDLLPTVAVWIAAWGLVAGGAIKLVQLTRPVVRRISAAIALVEFQLNADSGESLVDQVRETRTVARQARAKIDEHMRRDHDTGGRQ